MTVSMWTLEVDVLLTQNFPIRRKARVERTIAHPSQYGGPLELQHVSLDALMQVVLREKNFVFTLYSAKTSGSTGKALYHKLLGQRDTGNFINNPLGSLSYKKRPKFIASHYTCAKEQISRLLRLGRDNMVVLLPIRESTDLIISATHQALHKVCDQPQLVGSNESFTKDGRCVIEQDVFFDKILRKKAYEMSLTHLDCLDFDDLKTSLAISRSKVCFGDVDTVNIVTARLLAELEGEKLVPVNVRADKVNISIALEDNVTIESDVFLSENWPKIAAGLPYTVTKEHRWLENQIGDHPGSFLCNTEESG